MELYIYVYTRQKAFYREMAVQATFASMGIRAKKATSPHLLVENANENNLLSDISRVDYLANNRGRTHLRPLYGLPVFVDDVYAVGYLRKEDMQRRRTKFFVPPE